MELEVRLFGGLWERAGGQRRVTVTLPDDATVADLRTRLATDHPALADLLPRVNVAVDLEVARDSQPLDGASEVAVLPPVAGGADEPAPRVVTGLVAPPFDVDAVLADITAPPVGAAVSFLGTVRDHAPDLDGVVRLDYSAYPEMADKVLADIAAELLEEHPAVRGLALLHATGELAVGDHTILVAACAAHRAAAFDACREGLERVKDRVPVWKREVTADGEHRWVGLTAPPGVDASPSPQPAGVAPAADATAPGSASDPRTDPPGEGDERATLVGFLRWQRETLQMKCAGLDADQLARRAVGPSTMSLLGLVRHLADVERGWFRRFLAGQDAPPYFWGRGDEPDTDFDGALADPDLVEDAWRLWHEEVAFADAFVADAPDLGITGGGADREPRSLRWVLTHMIEEYARHNGHADLLRERIDGSVGE